MAPLPPAAQPQMTVAAIYAAYEAAATDGRRPHLGASVIGTECERALWFTFRWATVPKHDGRMLRLFDTGNRAEERFVADLRRAGVTIMDVDPETGRQWRVQDAGGHFGGSMDGVAIGILEAPKAWHVCEFKTHSEKSFRKLVAEGVEKAKPLHFAQMQIYMLLTGMERAFYLAVNKNTDELYQERVRLDREVAMRLHAKALRVIASPVPLARISDDPSWYLCRSCDHAPVCHGGAMPERHCRSCLHSTPVDGGGWHCARHDTALSDADQRTGCAAHLFIPDLVPGQQEDAGEDWVSYRMRDGSAWVDGAGGRGMTSERDA